jgi:hypothetical protein
MFAGFMLWQRAFNPVVMMPDSTSIVHAYYDNFYNTFRTPLYSFISAWIYRLAPTVPQIQWVVFAQMLAFSSVLSTALMYFNKNGIRFRYLLITAGGLSLFPSLGLHSIFLVPDVPFAISMLWLAYVMVRVIDEIIIHDNASKRQEISLCVQLCISTVFVFFMRSNSFLVVVILAPVLLLLFLMKKRWKLSVAVIFSVLIILLIRFPGYSALNPRTTFNGTAGYFAAMHDIRGTYYKGGNLSEQTLTLLREYIPSLDDPDRINDFSPDYITGVWAGDVFNYNVLSGRRVVTAYIDTFLRNPMKLTGSMLHRVREYWVIDPKSSIFLENFTGIWYTGSVGLTNTDFPAIGVFRQENFLTGIMNEYMRLMSQRIPATFIWRFGFWTLLMIISAMTLVLRKRYIWLLTFIPVFVYIFTLLLSKGWTDYRYGLSVFLIGMFLPAILVLKEYPGQQTIHNLS